MAYVDWAIQGPAIANCNCDFSCPCQFNALPTHGDCRAMTAGKIDKGHFGNVDLSGLSWCWMFAWPKAVHQGDGEALLVIDDRATKAQREALQAILSGRETAPGANVFNVYASTLSKIHDPIYAPIELELDIDGRTGHVRIPGIMDTSAEPIRNPVTGQPHRARVALPNGFEYREAEFASGGTQANGPVKLAFERSHAHLYSMHMTTNGVV